MKQFLSIILVLGILISADSCKKSPAETIVEYQVNPADNYIVQINYNDQSGNPITVTNMSQFVNGIKDISITQKPFTAKLQVQVNNLGYSQASYTIVISVDGKPKAYSQFAVPPNAIGTSEQLEYVVN